jgi:transglutaminase-like putative cysteine protease
MRLCGLLVLVSLVACSPADPDASPPCCKEAPPAKTPGIEAGPGAAQVVGKDFLRSAGTRTFSIEYVAKVPAVPAGTRRLRLWIPVPSASTVQDIRNLSFSREPRIGREAKYGNTIASWEIAAPSAPVEVAMKFDVTRREVLTDLGKLREDGRDGPDAFEVFRKPDSLVLVDDGIRKMAAEIVKGRTGTLQKARAIYDHVVSKMVYDKNHSGWGLGSTEHACKVGKGNCTDFHALFNSLCRAEDIASGFEIGLYLPYEKGAAEAPGGYHCWAWFRVPGKTWVPVDCSEAMRLPDRRDYFFGGHTSNRVAFSTGRDLVLEPRQDGPPLNFFLNPYAEADGRPVEAVKTWAYRDLEG